MCTVHVFSLVNTIFLSFKFNLFFSTHLNHKQFKAKYRLGLITWILVKGVFISVIPTRLNPLSGVKRHQLHQTLGVYIYNCFVFKQPCYSVCQIPHSRHNSNEGQLKQFLIVLIKINHQLNMSFT